MSTTRIAIASFGHACTQAGASPSASRSLHMSHLRTMPRLRVVLRHLVRAGEHAVLAADALVVEVLDDAGDRVLLVRVHRAAVQARRVEAVVAGGRDVCCTGAWLRAAVQAGRPSRQVSSSSSPFRLWQAATHALQPVQASRSTSKAYCSPAAGLRERDQRLVAAGGRRVARLVALREALDRGQVALFQQQLADQQALRGRGHDPSTMRDRRWGYQGRTGFKLLKLLSFLETTSRRSRNQPETRRARWRSAAD